MVRIEVKRSDIQIEIEKSIKGIKITSYVLVMCNLCAAKEGRCSFKIK